MIFAFLALCLASEAETPPAVTNNPDPLEPGLSAPNYVKDLSFLGRILLIFIFICIIFFISYPRKKLLKYQKWLISILGPTLAVSHFLDVYESTFSLTIAIVIGLIAVVLGARKEFQAIPLSIANAYFGGYLILMFFAIGVKLLGIPLLILFFLFDYYFLSFIGPVSANYAIGSTCTFLFLCIIYNFFDAFKPMFLVTPGRGFLESFLDFDKNVSRAVFFLSAIFFYVIYPFAAKSILNHFLGVEPPEKENLEEPAPKAQEEAV